jgi:hypothetical protein
MTRELDLIGISREDSVLFFVTFLIFSIFCIRIAPTCMRWFAPPPILSTEEWRARPG